jgi:predicted permease
MRVLLRRFANLFRRDRLEAELDEEVRSHLDMAVDDNLRRGMTADEARHQALRDFGGVDQVKEIYRERRGLPLVETTLLDVRFAVRTLRRNPGFAALAILCLTVGIGANAVVLGWIEGILLRPYPLVAHQERLLALTGTVRGSDDTDAVSWPDFDDFRNGAATTDAFIAEKITGTTLSDGQRAERAVGSVVSANYFDALGISPILGRGFEPVEETGRNAHPVMVISYRTWKDRFHGDPAILGKTQKLDGVPHTIVGVAPEGFFGTFVGYAFQFWVPASMQELFEPGGYKIEDRGARWIEGFVRLKPGVTRDQAQEELSALARRLETAYPDTNRGRGIRLFPLWRTPFNGAGLLGPTLGMALAVALFVLLIACANVGNLLLVRSVARRHEMTVRLAVGAGRSRLVRQLLTEGLILAVLGAAGGLLVADWCRGLLALLMPVRSAPLYLPGAIDARVFAAVAGAAVVATLLSALAPAFQTSRVDVAASLKDETAAVVGGHGRHRIRSALVVVQVCLSFLLLVGAGLVLRSLGSIRGASPGFTTDGVLLTHVSLSPADYDTARVRSFQEELIAKVRALPEVENAAWGRVAPFGFPSFSSAPIAVEGHDTPPDEPPSAEFIEVSPGYFATLGIPLLSGREFTRADDENAPAVAIVNEAMVGRYWHGEDPVGRRLRVKDRWMQVIGVAKLAKYRDFLEAPRPLFYVPLRQNPSPEVGLVLRTSQPPEAVARALAAAMHALDPDLPAHEVIPMREQIDRSTSTQHIAVTLLTAFGGLALLFAAIGLYGVMSCAVSQGTRELALRKVLGARPADLLRLVMSQGCILTAAGAGIGIAAAIGTTRLLGYLLYKVSPLDPLTFLGALVLMGFAAAAACVLPAWRAAQSDPARVLRD